MQLSEMAKSMFSEELEKLNAAPTLRDQFAMAALTGLLAGNGQNLAKAFWDKDDALAEYLAKASYHTADAMLAARQKERE